ncbi:MAG TPA: hypothetical protein VEL76_42770 [Gemmataceae bacterium]|nr:hypothetical protein [Gemmataceae bacterium]
MDKLTQILIDAIKQAANEPGEQRLFRAGKLPGVFPSRVGLSAQAAEQALRDGLLERARTEVKGKTSIEWVRLTPKGMDFLHNHESPVRAMDELCEILQMTQEGVPVWMNEIRQQLNALGQRLTDEVQTIMHRLAALSQRVQEVLHRTGAAVPPPEDAAALVPWGAEALGYLDRRRASGVVNSCPMPELFAAIKEKAPDLTVKEFHDGLRKLHTRGLLQLLKFEGPDGPPEPEYALLDGASTYYLVLRS